MFPRVVDGLKGFPEAITGVFPVCVVQTCIVHLIRYSMQFASWKERKALARALRPIYSAASAEAASAALDDFERGPQFFCTDSAALQRRRVVWTCSSRMRRNTQFISRARFMRNGAMLIRRLSV
jgi:transposase-like protein